VIYSSDVFTYNAKYFQTFSGQKLWSFISSLRSMLKLRSTAWSCLAIIPIWPTVLDWCLAGSFLQLLLGHYSVQIGYQREHNYTEIVPKHVFLNNTFTFCATGLLDESCSKKLNVKKKKVAIKNFCNQLKHRTT